jgi:competence protein ComEC
MMGPRPDIVIDRSGAAVAVRGEDGAYRILGGKGTSFAIETWLRADADTRKPDDKSLRDGVSCDTLGCTARIGATGTVAALALDPRAFIDDCTAATAVVAAFDAPMNRGRRASLSTQPTAKRRWRMRRSAGSGRVAPAFRPRAAITLVQRLMPPVPYQ